jgi:hypothetical protein
MVVLFTPTCWAEALPLIRAENAEWAARWAIAKAKEATRAANRAKRRIVGTTGIEVARSSSRSIALA